jgi:hypothetical protein
MTEIATITSQQAPTSTGEIDPPVSDTGWQSAVRQRVLSARQALLRHPWASRVIETRTNRTPSCSGCDEQFEFALDLLLDSFERLRDQGWTSPGRPRARRRPPGS